MTKPWRPIFLLAIGLLAGAQAHAAQLKRVQSGTVQILDGSSTATATLSAADTTKSFLVFSLSEDPGSVANRGFWGRPLFATQAA